MIGSLISITLEAKQTPDADNPITCSFIGVHEPESVAVSGSFSRNAPLYEVKFTSMAGTTAVTSF
jgi:hypothetical protein